ncbi:hypothetical protein PpBr36_07464 [Pyricularia pennisetigena]|uniref:hypothetical protein n=1 Tax=Pyricularia pennisetigena TaxID=1578925 RepID=UPI00115162F1|nr:hypothetical protein PpBr36_07464 [Pyricularia pennisetigena]TLS25163.1 hypothetical protein PpBr36_07464 [Pyricularia pennisetigena]
MGVISQAMDFYNRERPGVIRQPGRMTAIKTMKRPRQSKPSATYSVDPVELSRRLSLVLEEQQRNAERRRRASLNPDFASAPHVSGHQQDCIAADLSVSTGLRRPEAKIDTHKRKPVQQPSSEDVAKDDTQPSHPYVPREAALQFSVTTTAISMREGTGTTGLVRRLSRSALKLHLSRDEQQKASNGRKSESNQVHGGRIAEEVEGHPSGKSDQQEENKRGSKGLYPERKSEDPNVRDSQVVPDSLDHHGGTTPPPPPVKPLHISIANEHRVDWTQSDEVKKNKLSPLLRRPVSTWTLRGRLVGKEKGSFSNEVGPESPELKSPKYGFFARFRR